MKAEIRFIDGDYYITQGDKKIAVQEYAEVDSIIVNMPDGTTLHTENLSGKTIMMAACFLNDITLVDKENGDDKRKEIAPDHQAENTLGS